MCQLKLKFVRLGDKMKKSKFTTIGILLTTLILGGVAIFTAIRLYQTRQTAVAPNVPSSEPLAADNSCKLSFSLSISSPTATATSAPGCNTSCTTNANCPTGYTCWGEEPGDPKVCRNTTCQWQASCVCPTSTAIATATATATSNPECNNSCTENTDCPDGLMCSIPSGATTGSCRNTSCLSETDCLCPVATATATATSLAEEPTLPDAGTSWPTILGTAFGILIILGSLLLAF